MTIDSGPFSVPAKLAPAHARVQAYWEGLERGENAIPFWDDVNPSALGELADSTVLLDVFDDPPRFRFGVVGKRIETYFGRAISGRFLDELEHRPVFDRLDALCRAAVERRSPAYASDAAGYTRLVLPLWGEGRVSMLLVVVTK